MQVVFDTHGNEKQKECARYWTDKETFDLVYGGAKGGAKSYTGCSLICGDAFIYPETHYFIARKTLADIRKFTIPSIHEVFQHWGVKENQYKFNGQDNFYLLNNGSKIFLIDAKDMPSDPYFQRFGSMQMTRGWIEESGEFSVNAKNNLQASVGRWKNDVYGLHPKILQTCNPAHNYLYTQYYKPFVNGTLEKHKKFIQALPQDNKMLPKGYIDNLLKSLSPSEIERLIYGNWDYSDDPASLTDFDAICDAFTNDHIKEGHKRISADLALQGRDSFVVGLWNGMICQVKIDKPKATAPEVEQDLKNLKVVNSVPNSKIVADSDGLGAYLEGYIKNIKAFHAVAKPVNKKEFASLKDELAYKLAEKINSREILIKCTQQQEEKIKTELSTCLKADSVDNDGKKRIIPKKKQKELLGGKSPDYFDMLMMGMYFEVKPIPGGRVKSFGS